ncbi:ATP-binding protein [Plantactinospora sp. KLBMP9567]|uniref:ATP-binding protein n=1 Tax=Plantactinospora sp. KLBMP9567 TaxID=3085900 RepID=UPI002982A4F7|nr:ATP-binding protein [Plantactinospora sp. KLBMP9567]MDW5323665.1 ATP-binding protein [Plantactinospora sp. KLBMP9567]
MLQADFDAEQVADVRRTLTECLLAAGLAGERLDDFVTAVNEAMTNAVRHGGGRGELRIWHRRHLVCEIRDHGRGFAAPLPTIPTRRPRPSANGGMGLWLAQELADSIEVQSGTNGVRVRLSMAVTDPAEAPPSPGLDGVAGSGGPGQASSSTGRGNRSSS